MFFPPAAFVKASLARQAQIRKHQSERAGSQQSLLSGDSSISLIDDQCSRKLKVDTGSQSCQDTAGASNSVSLGVKPVTTTSDRSATNRSLSEAAKALSSQTLDLFDNAPQKIVTARLSQINRVAKDFDALCSSLPSLSPSKTVVKVAKLRDARVARRAAAAELKRASDSIDDFEKDYRAFNDAIDKFRRKLETTDRSNNKHLLNKGTIDHVDGIRVCVRKRPINARESNGRFVDVVTTRSASYPFATVYVHEPKVRLDRTKYLETHRFHLDNSFDEHASNADVYAAVVQPLVRSIFTGGRCTFFAYGQTGSGKTHTIFGSSKEPGIYQHVSKELFALLQYHREQSTSNQLSLRVNFFEIYGPKVRDLLSPAQERVQMLEDRLGSVQLVGLTEYEVRGEDDLLRIASLGQKQRAVGTTEANSESSRSHAIITISLCETNRETKSELVTGKLSLVDLAGSERGADVSSSSKQSRTESAEINKSLLALKECIRALHSHALKRPGSQTTSDHIPFRGSKLTQILRDSFVDSKSRTVMVATINPASNAAEHTLNTMRYADRVKELKTKRESNGITADTGDTAENLRTLNHEDIEEYNESDYSSACGEFDYSDPIVEGPRSDSASDRTFDSMSNHSIDKGSSFLFTDCELQCGRNDLVTSSEPMEDATALCQSNNLKLNNQRKNSHILALMRMHENSLRVEDSIIQRERALLSSIDVTTKMGREFYIDGLKEFLKRRTDDINCMWEAVKYFENFGDHN